MTADAVESLQLRRGRWIYRLSRILYPLLRVWFRCRLEGLENLPEGPAVLAANHGGGLGLGDAVFWIAYHRLRGPDAEPIYVLAHRLFSRWTPGLRSLLPRFGIVEASPANARAILAAGYKLLVYPGGDHDSLRPFARRAEVELGGRRGFFDLARDAGVPLVPVTTAGSHETFIVLAQGKALAARLGMRRMGLHSFPVILCLPWILLVGPFAALPYLPLPAKVEVHVGAPFPAEDYDDALSVIGQQLAAQYARRRWPVLG